MFLFGKLKCVDIMAIVSLKILNVRKLKVSRLLGGMYLNKGKLQAGKVRLPDNKASPLGAGRLQKGQSEGRVRSCRRARNEISPPADGPKYELS